MKIVFITVCLVCSFRAYSQELNMPLIKGHNGGDTTVHFSTTFIIHDRTYTPVTQMTVVWNAANNVFSMTGNANSTVDGSDMHFSFGSTDAQLLVNGSGSITYYLPYLTGEFHLEGQRYLGVSGSTFFSYNTTTHQEFIYGNVRITLDGADFNARMGSSDDPGALISNNSVQKVWVHLSDLLKMKGLIAKDANKTDVILRHLSSDPANTYYGYGQWYVNILEVDQFANLGTGANPGVVVTNGQIDSVKMSGFGFGVMLGVLPVLDNFHFDYDPELDKYVLNGLVVVGVPMGGLFKLFGAKYAPSFEINANEPGKPGFFLNPVNGKLIVENASFSLKAINGSQKISAGGFEINDLTVVVENGIPDSIYGRGTFPPGFSLAVGLSFQIDHTTLDPYARFFINSLSVTWEAQNVTQAIPVGDSGFQIVKIGGAVDNLLNPEKLVLVGDIGMVFGEPVELDLSVFSIPGLTGTKLISIIYVEGVVTLSYTGLSFEATGDLGSLFTGGHWQGIIAELDAGIDIKWSGVVKLNAGIKAYVPPYDVIDATANLTLHNSGDIDGLGTATMQVPPAIPVIGGKHLGNAHFALRHLQNDLRKSYAAAWSKFNLGFDHVTAGIKANFKTGKISKIGAAAARSLTHQIISDTLQHPIGPNGEPVLDWYACGLTHHFTLPTDNPPAYLQSQLVINDHRFENPLVQHQYYNPAIAALTSPSSSIDVKLLTPSEPHHIYENQDQTTAQDNTLSIDFTKNLTQGGSDSIKWITVNQAAESYSSIDWVHQPDLLLTPGEYVLKVSGYCHVNATPLSTSDMHVNISPVYPRPTISLDVDEEGTMTVDYSSYLTDSTNVSLYWSFEKNIGGNLIAHLPYHNGTLIGDSLYRWVVSNWDPGIIPSNKMYFYAVIDDYTNSPVTSTYDSLSFIINFKVSVDGGSDSTEIVLSPGDTTLSDVAGIRRTDGQYVFCNMAPGEYTVHAYNKDTTKSFTLNMNMWNVDGTILDEYYHTPDWVTLRFNALVWPASDALVTFSLAGEGVQLYGHVTDSAQVTLDGNVKVALLDAQHMVVAQAAVTEAGYRFGSVPNGIYTLAVQLPVDNTHHWASVEQIEYVQSAGLFGFALMVDSVDINSETKIMNFTAVPGPQAPIFWATDVDQHGIGDLVVSIHRQDGQGALLQSVTNEKGYAFFRSADMTENKTYTFNLSWPSGFHGITPSGQNFIWAGGPDLQSLTGAEN